MEFLQPFKRFSLRNLPAWRYFASCFSGTYHNIAWTTIASAAQTLLIIPSLLLIKYAFDHVIPERDTRLLVWIGVLIFLLRLLSALSSVWIRNIHIRLINRGISNIRKDLISRIYRLPYQTYTTTDLRIAHARIVQDSERLTNMSTAIISRLIPSILIGSGLLVVCMILNARLLLIMLAMAPLVMVANRIMGRRINHRVTIFQKAFEEFSKGIQLTLRFLPLTVMQTAEKQETEKQRSIVHVLEHETGKMAKIFSLNLQLQETLTGLTAIIIIVVGGISVATAKMTLGDFLSFYLAALYLNKSINTITSAIPDLIAGNISLKKVHELTNGFDEEQNATSKPEIPLEGSIEMADVSFSYGEKPVLSGITLTIHLKAWISLSGPNGAGKTTLLHLITGILEPTAGTISASGIPYSLQSTGYLRKNIGVVPQHPLLFPGTIMDNITYGTDNIDPDHAIQICKLTLAHDFIVSLPDNYNTQVGDDGVLLSGGEGQRIAIARALYRNPALLILDEPTNHLERTHAEQILSNIKSMDNPPAVCIISHDYLARGFAARHYRLEGGFLTETDHNG
jgi:ABC-type bacteriocin/lantibiotic exporter with double-glycine peptidase domain